MTRKHQGGGETVQTEAVLCGCSSTDPVPLSPLDPGFHPCNLSSPGFLLQGRATIKKMEQLFLKKKNVEQENLHMEKRISEKNIDDKDKSNRHNSVANSDYKGL